MTIGHISKNIEISKYTRKAKNRNENVVQCRQNKQKVQPLPKCSLSLTFQLIQARSSTGNAYSKLTPNKEHSQNTPSFLWTHKAWDSTLSIGQDFYVRTNQVLAAGCWKGATIIFLSLAAWQGLGCCRLTNYGLLRPIFCCFNLTMWEVPGSEWLYFKIKYLG